MATHHETRHDVRGPMDHRMLGIACVLSAVTLFILQDATIKWLSGTYPLHEVILVRASSAVAVTLLAMRLEGGFRLWRTRRAGLILARSILLVVANSAFFLGLASMSIAEATSIFFIAPVLITALTALVLREPVGLRRWAAVCVGLAGVIVILRPGEGA
ncbi:MAG: DMT family transporter, partial [Deltaproteobacteria bacterium]|nr:DMT family transporter [Deltaproteobacteria bacterium]